MWLDAPATRTPLGQKMRQFMTQCAVDLRLSVIDQARIERNKPTPCVGPPGAAAQSPVPFHADLFG